MPNLGVWESVGIPSCPTPFSAAEFFQDSPWLRVPENRRAQILVEALRHPGRLLGGSSRQEGGPPKSKLAALAAARKKENQNPKDAHLMTSSVALLDKLSLKSGKSAQPSQETRLASPADQAQTDSNAKRYQSRRRRSLTPPPTESVPSEPFPAKEIDPTIDSPSGRPVPTASPSVFAKAMFGPTVPGPDRGMDLVDFSLLALSNDDANADAEAFAGPSPDDIVLKAQSASKGSK